ncbi:phosphatase PAP2 family protein [Streptococcus halotolerans]|uniref:phosphatase PAP2 family protein n=1 Tax=Streptococcus halotolerans TaxID=1814128 RepID=UPI00078859DE|nr:phosphatase PAP2 family protein [Streptococcus halotolerans]
MRRLLPLNTSKDYEVFYGKILQAVAKYPFLKPMILGYNGFVTKLMYLLYPLLLIFLYMENRQDLWKTILVPGVSFLLISVFRRMFNQPRPYETWPITPIMNRDGQGESFPSRHVFSASIISMCFLFQFAWLGLFLLILTLGLAVCRVLGGVHYPKDVLAGYLLGIFGGMMLTLF